MERILKFPEDFLWGSATSAYQVEGGIENSDWSTPHQKNGGGPASTACDHYNRYEADFDLLKKLNQNAHRFSIEWSRIEPESGKFNEKELEHYWKVLHSLKRQDVKSTVTLFHWTLPSWMAKIGGWANKKSIFYFSRFAERVYEEYREMVDFWVTTNEPMTYAGESYFLGKRPPRKKNPMLFLKVINNQIVAHKKVYEVFHKAKIPVRVGVAKNNSYFEPFCFWSPLDKLSVFLVRYFWNEKFLNKIRNHLDFIGLNYYFHDKIIFPGIRRNENKVVNDLGWEIYPEGIYHVLKELKKYKKPIYITENGLADAKDNKRLDFIKDHLYWVHKAIKEGADVKGYFHWSLMDNFEWEKGFGPRFGLIEIDYKTLERKPRPSAFYYAEICKNNQLIINE